MWFFCFIKAFDYDYPENFRVYRSEGLNDSVKGLRGFFYGTFIVHLVVFSVFRRMPFICYVSVYMQQNMGAEVVVSGPVY